MALVIEGRKPFYTFNETALRLAIFTAHAVSAVLMLVKAFGVLDTGCDGLVYPTLRMATLDDPSVMSLSPSLFKLPVKRLRNSTVCTNDTSWNKGWCKAKNVPDYYDYANDNDSFTFGSSWNVIFAVAVFEWITASYALFYVDPFDSWMQYESLWWGMHPVPVICTLWNFVFLLSMWIYRGDLNVPPNNAFIYTFMLAATIVIQNFLSVNRSWRIDDEREETAVIEYKDTSLQLRTDMFLKTKRKGDYKPLRAAKNYDFHEPHYMQIYDRGCWSPIPRYLEYTVTAPLLLAALFASSVNSDLTWKFQFICIALAACNAIGIPLHYCVLNISYDVQRFAKAATYLLVASWLALITGIYIFVWTIRDFLLSNNSGMPQWVQMLVWVMLVMYSLFGVAATRYYLPRIMWDVKYGPDEYRWLSFYFDILSLAVKLPVAWTIWVKGATMMCETNVSC